MANNDYQDLADITTDIEAIDNGSVVRPQKMPRQNNGKAPEWFSSSYRLISGFNPRVLVQDKARRVIAVLICASSIGFLMLKANEAKNAEGRAALNTPASQQSKQSEMDQAIAVVLGQQVRFPDGSMRVVSDPAMIINAASSVLKWQESELVQRMANDTSIKIDSAIIKPGHACYSGTKESCIAYIREGLDRELEQAEREGNLDLQALTTMKNKAIDRVSTGELRPDQYKPFLAKVAQSKLRQSQVAQNYIADVSPNGQVILTDEGMAKQIFDASKNNP